MSSTMFTSLKVVELQDILRGKGISVSNVKRENLVKLCEAVVKLNLPDDPDMCADHPVSIYDILGKFSDDPFKIQGLSNDLTKLPTFSLYDVFNYLLYKTANYDQRKLKAYKSCEDYRLFFDGYVEKLEMKELEDGDNYLIKSCVKPTQKDRTYLNKTAYDVWVVMCKSGSVNCAYCTCIGGADGGCRHIGATLYEIEAFDVKSVTDGDNLWVKRPRHHDCPVPIKQLKILKARYASVDYHQSAAHSFDPRSVDQRQTYTEMEISEIAKNLREISPNIQALDILEVQKPVQNDKGDEADQQCPKCSAFTMPNMLKKIASCNANEFHNSENLCTLSNDNISHIESCTSEQSDCKIWHELRKGRLTASNFSKVCKAVDSNKCPPSLLKTILGEYGEISAPSLVWGKKKEKAALQHYMRMEDWVFAQRIQCSQ
ncbi:uncharacterized protein LOC134242809 [Saccostrea cucullata]|uniref:uncharacterized protein LOC134242809 n=1 Tax=Saccostrea cuccullata TaxID=36930 RepID=UPI002ED3EF1D